VFKVSWVIDLSRTYTLPRLQQIRKMAPQTLLAALQYSRRGLQCATLKSRDHIRSAQAQSITPGIQATVHAQMLGPVHHFQVVWVIVRPAMIDVMNSLVLVERSTYFVRSNQPMLKNVPPEIGVLVVWLVL